MESALLYKKRFPEKHLTTSPYKETSKLFEVLKVARELSPLMSIWLLSKLEKTDSIKSIDAGIYFTLEDNSISDSLFSWILYSSC